LPSAPIAETPLADGAGGRGLVHLRLQEAVLERRTAPDRWPVQPTALSVGACAGIALGLYRRTRGRTRLRGRAPRQSPARRRAWEEEGCELPPDGQGVAEAETTNGGSQSAVEEGGAARVALLLNRNARGVTIKVAQRLARLVRPDDCFLCCSLQDAEDAVREVLDRGVYGVIACGGGDGTLASILNLLVEEVAARRRAGAQLEVIPSLAVLRLGTGNGLSYVLGSAKDAAVDLRRLLACTSEDGAADIPTIPAKMLALRSGAEIPEALHSSTPEASQVALEDGKETLCFFAGMGYDARMLRDYVWLKGKTADSKLLRPWVHSPFGYVLALLFRTLPATLRWEHVFRLRVVNLAEEAYYMDPRRGDWAVLQPRDSVLYEGEAGIVSVGAVPFYGGGFQLFPFAGFPGFVHLRISDIHPALATLKMIPLWRGHYRNARHVKDFLVREAIIEADQAVPLQHSGELVGEVKKLHLRVSDDNKARLVDFFGAEDMDDGKAEKVS